MAQVKWIKIVTDIFDDEKMLLIESLPEADSIIVIWFKLLTLAGKQNNSGVFMLNDRMPYTDEMFATIFRRKKTTVQMALKTFEEFGMIEVINNAITIPNWSKHQSLDQIENRNEYMKNYMREYREKQKELASGVSKVNSKVNSKPNSKLNVKQLEEEEEREVDKKENKNTTSTTFRNSIIELWNKLEEPIANVQAINPNTVRYTSLKARVSEHGNDNIIKAINNINNSSFLKGNNERGWVITFDWFIKPNNFIKVLEGNYDDKQAEVKQKPQYKENSLAAIDDRMSEDERVAFVYNKMNKPLPL